jgi:hypothetical protein
MKHKNLLILFLYLLCGCTSGLRPLNELRELEKIYSDVQTPCSGTVYFCSEQTVEQELVELKMVINDLDPVKDSTLYRLLTTQIEICDEFQRRRRTLMADTSGIPLKPSYNAKPIQCVVPWPPHPCPEGTFFSQDSKSSVYYSGSEEDTTRANRPKGKILKNGNLLKDLGTGKYHKKTGIKSFKIPQSLDLHIGDTIVLSLPYEYKGSDGSINETTIEYSEIMR